MAMIAWDCPRCNTRHTAEVEIGNHGAPVNRRPQVQCSNCGAGVTLTLSSTDDGPASVAAGMTLPGREDPS